MKVLTPSDYHSAYTLVGIIALSYVASGLYRVFTTVLSYHHRLWVISVGAVLSGVLSVGLLFAFVPSYGSDAAAWSFLASTALYAAWLAWWSQRTDPLPLHWSLLRPTVAMAGLVLLATSSSRSSTRRRGWPSRPRRPCWRRTWARSS